jgi:alpha-beta hydrolase superfamily lysophospholipase
MQTFTDAHGVEVFYRTWPRADAKASVVVSHGASEHSARYDRFARALNEAGYAVWAIDHRGHGQTGTSTGPGRIGAGGGDALIDDVGQLIDIASAAAPGLPVVLFGHSMGSMIAQAYVTRRGDGLTAYVLSGCPGSAPEAAAMIEGLQGAVDAGMGAEPLDMLGGYNTAFEPARTKYDWLSRDEAEVDRYINDPLCGDNNPLTYEFALALLQLSAPAMEADAIGSATKLPVLLITGEQDPAAGMAENARELEGRLRAADFEVTALYYPDARHELLNELNRDDVTADVVAWLATQV